MNDPSHPRPAAQEDALLVALLPGVRSGDPEALDRWYRREWPTVYRLCFGLLGDPGAADDAAQDAMLRLSDTLGGFDVSRSYAAWRTTVVLNLCRDRQRQVAARTRAEESAGERFYRAASPHPEVEAQHSELCAALEVALVRLTEREREAFVLFDLEGLDAATASETMGIGQSSLRSLLALARRRLRGLLEAHMPALTATGSNPRGNEVPS